MDLMHEPIIAKVATVTKQHQVIFVVALRMVAEMGQSQNHGASRPFCRLKVPFLATSLLCPAMKPAMTETLASATR